MFPLRGRGGGEACGDWKEILRFLPTPGVFDWVSGKEQSHGQAGGGVGGK